MKVKITGLKQAFAAAFESDPMLMDRPKIRELRSRISGGILAAAHDSLLVIADGQSRRTGIPLHLMMVRVTSQFAQGAALLVDRVSGEAEAAGYDKKSISVALDVSAKQYAAAVPNADMFAEVSIEAREAGKSNGCIIDDWEFVLAPDRAAL